MKLKPLPKAIAVIIVVGAIGYGVNLFLEHRAASQPAEVVAQPAPAINVAPAPAPVVQTPTAPVQTESSDNAGLNRLLQQGKK